MEQERANPQSPLGRFWALSPALRIILIISLALNMFLLGAGTVLFGRFLLHPNPPPFFHGVGHPGEFPGPGIIFRTLPPEARERVETAIGPERAAMQRAVAAARQARRAAFQAFAANPYSAEAAKEKLEASQAADIAAVTAAHAVMSKITATLNPEERAALIEGLRRMPRPGAEHPPGEMPGPPPGGIGPTGDEGGGPAPPPAP